MFQGVSLYILEILLILHFLIIMKVESLLQEASLPRFILEILIFSNFLIIMKVAAPLDPPLLRRALAAHAAGVINIKTTGFYLL